MEWLNYEYYGSFNGIDYAIQIILTVDSPNAFALYDPEADLDLILYDRISYSSSVSRGTAMGVGGGVDIVASYRGNTIHDDDIAFLHVINFAEEIEINGVPYKDVWYWDRAGTPSLYVQKYHGIIAFAGMDGEVWVLQ